MSLGSISTAVWKLLQFCCEHVSYAPSLSASGDGRASTIASNNTEIVCLPHLQNIDIGSKEHKLAYVAQIQAT